MRWEGHGIQSSLLQNSREVGRSRSVIVAVIVDYLQVYFSEDHPVGFRRGEPWSLGFRKRLLHFSTTFLTISSLFSKSSLCLSSFCEFIYTYIITLASEMKISHSGLPEDACCTLLR